MPQVPFLDVFIEKDPHLNAVEGLSVAKNCIRPESAPLKYEVISDWQEQG